MVLSGALPGKPTLHIKGHSVNIYHLTRHAHVAPPGSGEIEEAVVIAEDEKAARHTWPVINLNPRYPVAWLNHSSAGWAWWWRGVRLKNWVDPIQIQAELLGEAAPGQTARAVIFYRQA